MNENSSTYAKGRIVATNIEKAGVVKSVNQFGFRMEGSDDYFDYTKQHDVAHADKGDRVMLGVSPKADGKWWVNTLEVVTNGAPATNGHTPAATYGDDRQQSIVRQSSLKAAVEFYGLVTHDAEACGKASDHVLMLAAKFEEWVNR